MENCASTESQGNLSKNPGDLVAEKLPDNAVVSEHESENDSKSFIFNLF